MVRLLFNDLRLNLAWFFWVFLLLNLELILNSVWYVYPHRYAGLSVGISYAMIFPLVLFLREDHWKAQIVNRSLPLSGTRVVIARYVAICFLGLLPAFYGWLYQGIIEMIGPHASLSYLAQQMEAGYALEHSLIARLIGLTIALAIVLPLVLRFGSVWTLIFGYVGLRVVWGKFTDYLLGLSLHSTFFLGLSRWVFFASVFIIAILSMSIRLSIWLYGQRDM